MLTRALIHTHNGVTRGRILHHINMRGDTSL